MHRSERVVVGHRFYRGFKHDAHPMAIMVGVAGALSAFYAKAADIACASMPVDSAVWHPKALLDMLVASASRVRRRVLLGPVSTSCREA